MLPFKLQIILFLTSVVGLIGIVLLIRKNYLELKYAFIWISIAIVSTILSVFPNILKFISQLIGIELPVNALFLFGFYFILCILFSLTVIVSRNARRVKILNQELAILKNQLEEFRNA